MNRALLERPFAPEEIRHRVGRHGKVLDYVEGRGVVQRLNDAFDGRWSFEIQRYEVRQDLGEVVVLGRLSAGDVVKTQFGGSTLTLSRDGGAPLSLADDLKAAATDCLKKAASLLGVALHLYADEPASSAGALPPPAPATTGAPAPREDAATSTASPTTATALPGKPPTPCPALEEEAPRVVKEADVPSPGEDDPPRKPLSADVSAGSEPGLESNPPAVCAPAPRRGPRVVSLPASSSPSPQTGRPATRGATPEARITSRQFGFLLSLLTQVGLSKGRADEHCRKHHGVDLAHLSRPQASALIDALVEGKVPLVTPSHDAGRGPEPPKEGAARSAVLVLPTKRSPHGPPASPARVP